MFLVLAVGWIAQVVQCHRNHLGWRIEETDTARLQLRGVFRFEQQVPGVGRRVGTQRCLDLLGVEADTDRTPHVREGMLVTRVAHGNGLEQVGVQVLPVRQLGLVQLLVDASLDLLGQEVVRRYNDVVTGLACQQLGFKGFVAVKDVIDNLDARLVFKLLDGVGCDVVGPVVHVQYFVIGLNRAGHQTHYGHGKQSLASELFT
ncbi:hypothetical protein D9M69_491710 [compost metagenome]